MFTNERVSGIQAVILTAAAALGTIFLDIPIIAIEEGGLQGWLSILPGYSLMIIGVYAVVKLGEKYPNETVIQYAPNVVGTMIGKLFGLTLIITFTVFAGFLVRLNSELLLLLMPETPAVAFKVLIVSLAIYSMKSGFEVFARACQLLVPLIILGLILVFIFSLENIELDNFLPLFEEGYLEPLGFLPNAMALSGEAVLFMAFWYCTLNTKEEGLRAGAIGLVSMGLLLTVTVLVTIGSLGPDKVLNHNFPIFSLTRFILVLEFMQGYEGLLTIVWVSASFIKVTIFLYPAVVGASQWLNLQDYKPLVFPFALLVISAAYVPETKGDVDEMIGLINLYAILPLAFFLLIMAIIEGVKTKLQNQ
ncbi:GerAB/ArcD/ProY family transporter [Natranaerobius thermophilus]|uniref:Spore germination protein n=1 Tax=Natranaerobius thermophilus (strain ATCC BAA-1301 / DSM 18059 / JW/NM-WN-LF) TaxID=457570 RepID=B2A892_NATTJ|nr:GerAB/ArcD/ProY family transporter [Natranaerobius thermophilus]ACB84458.1 spore germination protein [Natranaerobius thermophilus JW/NM-WN-LF]